MFRAPELGLEPIAFQEKMLTLSPLMPKSILMAATPRHDAKLPAPSASARMNRMRDRRRVLSGPLHKRGWPVESRPRTANGYPLDLRASSLEVLREWICRMIVDSARSISTNVNGAAPDNTSRLVRRAADARWRSVPPIYQFVRRSGWQSSPKGSPRYNHVSSIGSASGVRFRRVDKLGRDARATLLPKVRGFRSQKQHPG